MKDVVAITTAAEWSFVLKKDGTVWRIGGNDSKQRALTKPEQIKGISKIKSISAGAEHLLGLGLRYDARIRWRHGSGRWCLGTESR
jgi:alpha-tubulin suppressor-like RCC1 family protein